MTTQPYPVGTRVVLTWSINPKFIGDTGVTLPRVEGPGSLVVRHDNLEPFVTTKWAQEVAWDDGEITLAAIAWLRPIQDPDAEPIEQEQREDMTA